MPRLTLAAADIHYRIDGHGDPLVFLHGAGANSLSWFQQIPAFSKHFTCLTMDHPGFGLSTWQGPPAPLSEVLDELTISFGWKRVGIVAHSLGGWAALRFGLMRPSKVAAVVLSSTWAGLQIPGVLRLLEERSSELRRGQERFRKGAAGAVMPGLGKRMAEEQPELCWLAAGISATNRGAGNAVWTTNEAGRYDNSTTPETRPEEVEGWSIPTLCLTGSADIVVPTRAIEFVAKALGDAELRRIDEAGHSLYLERPREFNDIVISFLRRRMVVTEETNRDR